MTAWLDTNRFSLLCIVIRRSVSQGKSSHQRLRLLFFFLSVCFSIIVRKQSHPRFLFFAYLAVDNAVTQTFFYIIPFLPCSNRPFLCYDKESSATCFQKLRKIYMHITNLNCKTVPTDFFLSVHSKTKLLSIGWKHFWVYETKTDASAHSETWTTTKVEPRRWELCAAGALDDNPQMPPGLLFVLFVLYVCHAPMRAVAQREAF